MYPKGRSDKRSFAGDDLGPVLQGLEHPKSLAEMVEARLRDAIVNAELPFGRPLPEDETGAALGVSRTPLRAALARLATQGLVTVVPNKGAFVFNPSLEDVKQLASFRLLLETNAVEQCFHTDPKAVYDELNAILSRMSEAQKAQDGKAYAQADTEFHETFFKHCGNAFLSNAFNAISWQVAALRAYLSVGRSWERDTSLSEHAEIVRAFEMRDSTRLRSILSDHVLRAAKAYANVVSQIATNE